MQNFQTISKHKSKLMTATYATTGQHVTIGN